jgi:hypothetical protein
MVAVAGGERHIDGWTHPSRCLKAAPDTLGCLLVYGGVAGVTDMMMAGVILAVVQKQPPIRLA